MVLFVYEEKCMHLASQDSKWMVDTWASNHATLVRGFFFKYKAGDFGKVKMENTNHSKTVGNSNFCIKTNVGYTLVLKDVRNTPDLKINLISGIALNWDGYENYFANRQWRLTKGSLMIAKGVAPYTLHKTTPEICEYGLHTAVDDTFANLWHRRLDYTMEKGWHILANKPLISF